MDLRVRGLAALDARAAPLPHGTEVVTRVDRGMLPEDPPNEAELRAFLVEVRKARLR